MDELSEPTENRATVVELRYSSTTGQIYEYEYQRLSVFDLQTTKIDFVMFLLLFFIVVSSFVFSIYFILFLL